LTCIPSTHETLPTYSNQLIGYHLLIKNKLGITMVPQAGGGERRPATTIAPD
jgi:hypothetical protein